MTELGSRLDVDTGPFMDTAAVMKCLDLFITSDTAVAHLAGALGVPVWMPLSTTPDWRWLTEREDNPWYPTMRIFRQQKYMDWAPVFDRIAVELRKLVPATVPTPSVTIETAPGELIDKITILEIKAERISDSGEAPQRADRAGDAAGSPRPHDLDIRRARGADGRAAIVNERSGRSKTRSAAASRAGDFGPKFVELARSVYKNNDRRAALKRRINVLLGRRSWRRSRTRGSCLSGRLLTGIGALPNLGDRRGNSLATDFAAVSL